MHREYKQAPEAPFPVSKGDLLINGGDDHAMLEGLTFLSEGPFRTKVR